MTTNTSSPGRLVALALLSDRHEVLLYCPIKSERHTLPAIPMAREGDDQERQAVLERLLATLVAVPSDAGDARWLGRFALPDAEGHRVDMLELYVARLEGARLLSDADAPRAWASLTAPAPEGRIDPAVALHVMPVLAALSGVDADE